MKNVCTKLLLTSLFLLFLSVNWVNANGLTVTGVSYAGTAATSEVRFSLGWNNSWNTNKTPNNWDAAWVFIKYRVCGSDPTVPWTHARINTTTAVHTHPGYEPTTADGATIPGIDAAPNNTGVMLRRNAIGVYPSTVAAACTLLLAAPTQFTAGVLYDVKVFGIEHVFIPSGAYWLGDDLPGTVTPFNSYHSFVNQRITSEAAIPALTMHNGVNTGATAVVASAQPANIPAVFPKGFKAFYMMKYEMTHGQYVGFLNTITANAQTQRYPGNALANRYALTSGNPAPDVFGTTRTDRAMNWIGWTDVSCYLDWAALRPLTEMEYEKACRGTNPAVCWEYAWGSRNIVEAKTISTTIPTENGAEVILDPNANCNYAGVALTGGDGGDGPLRVGIYAQGTSTTRMQTGSGFYGNMELTGNLWELYIQCTHNNPFDGTWGDGIIDESNGYHNQATWPLATLNYSNRADWVLNVVSIKGGAWNTGLGPGTIGNAGDANVSNRYYYYQGYSERASDRTGRGGR